MNSVMGYIETNPIGAVVYILMIAIIGLVSSVVYLFKDKQKQEVKNLDMLIRSLEALKNNAVSLEGVKEKLDNLLRKYG